jgi:DNA replication and repair protein RecF
VPIDSLRLELAQVRGFRNLAPLDLEPSSRFNVFAGDNGQGKTNLLEALYLGCTTRSFRTSKLAELVAHEAELTSVKLGVIEEGAGASGATTREQVVGISGGTRTVKLDGKRPTTLAAYAVKSPVVVFHPGEVALSQGTSAERRRLLDRAALYMEPGSLAEAEAYTRAVRERQRALETRGPSARDLDHWEELVVRHGLRVMAIRMRAAAALLESARAAFARIAAPDLVLEGHYRATAPDEPTAYAESLGAGRNVDARRKSASIGPHRDDLALSLNGFAVRGTASQGQHRAVVLALKAAEIDVIGAARGVRPILLLDDVSSELDRARTTALMTFLRDLEGQVFLTTTRPDLIETGPLAAAERRDFRVVGGRIEARASV